MKTLNQVLEQYEPSPGNKKFVAKHGMNRIADRNGNGDDVFKASNVKSYERTAVRHGYETGEDEKVYEEAEQIDELSKDTLSSYSNKSAAQLKSFASKRGRKSAADKATINKREVGKNRAYGKLETIAKAEHEKRWAERVAIAKTSNENFAKAVQAAAQGGGYHHISSSPHKDVYMKNHSNGAVNLLIHNKPPTNGDHSFNRPDIRIMNSSGSSWSSHSPRGASFRDEAPTSKDEHLSGIHHYIRDAEKRTVEDHDRELEYHKRDR